MLVPDVLKPQQSQIQKKDFNIGPVATNYYFLKYPWSKLFIAGKP